ncbi:MAG: PIN domain-containing protein [Phycisphaerae bacterium]|nr:PIN domain-containing protein [Phycisphaerae bacterium]NUQ45983.1 PIN domain-containing protein [Phycisphaerae bacterium]
MAIRTFIDAGVLIAAARGNNELFEAAMAILDDPQREFTTSVFVSLEVLPKAKYYGNGDEVEFYELFFAATVEMVHASERLVVDAHAQAVAAGLAAMDALHVAAACLAESVELVTTERPEKPMFRVSSPAVRTIRGNQ